MRTEITIIGAGPGGYIAAVRAAQLGADVTLIEKEEVGGTCLNWGCIPSKIMITTAQLLERFRCAAEFGIRFSEAPLADMPALMERKQKIIQSQIQGIQHLLKQHKIRYIKGNAYITGPNHASVTLEDRRAVEITWDKLILALGSRPLGLPSLPFDGRTIISSSDALSLRKIPKSIIIVGGGVIGCEFAFMLASLGSDVTVVEAMPRLLPLPSVDEDCSKLLQREMKKRKIKFMVNRSVEQIREADGKVQVVVSPSSAGSNPEAADSKPMMVEADQVLVCIGRRPNTDGVGLENLGVQIDEKGWIPANDRMETGILGVYAIGDVLGPKKGMLAHVASTEGKIAAENAMGGSRFMNYDIIPGAVFTSPEVANVGLTEIQARERGLNFRSDKVFLRIIGKAQVTGEIAGEAKILSNIEDGRIFGVHLVGAHATDLIAEAVLAMQMGGTVKDLAATIHAHPTLSEVMLEVSCKALDQPIHG